MTYLPEAELLLSELEKELVGKKAKEIWVRDPSVLRVPDSVSAFTKQLSTGKIVEVSRRGTILLCELENSTVFGIKPGFRSRITRQTANAEPTDLVRFTVSFTTGGSLHYSDVDGDGQVFVLDADALDTIDELTNLGFDPLNEPIPWTTFGQELKNRAAPLYTVLSSNDFMVGLGEIYTD